MATIPHYQQTPSGIMKVLQLFHQAKLSYILFKCEHIFAGKNKNVDILFETDQDYRQAALLLEQQGWALRFSEKFEKYKLMYCGFVGIDGQESDRSNNNEQNNNEQNSNGPNNNGQQSFHSIHLHREVAWHGMKAVDKKYLFERKKMVAPLIMVPSVEDSILIHAAHVLFENFAVTEKERPFLNRFLDQNRDGKYPGSIDQKYLQQQLTHNKWEAGFASVLKHKDSPALPFGSITAAWIKRLVQEPATAAYVGMKITKKIFRPLRWKRQGCLIAVIGVNGSGKSTLSRLLRQQLEPLSSHLGKRTHYYYFGWKPALALTRWISSLLRKNHHRVFQDLNLSPRQQRFSLKEEVLFCYLYLEFIYRYLRHIRPKLKRGEVIITDRYFYDLYGQYQYAPQSLLLKPLLQLFPRPDKTYILDAPLETLLTRDKTDREQNAVQKTPRQLLPQEYLKQQRQRYLFLARYLPAPIINTDNKPQQSVKDLVADIWRSLL